ncbi:VOC family protein [Xanthomonas citri pv. anacardii]|uniref:bleomycin resistance protein n=1 Tax=Xanthomonas citri TaxID=346 RepID=UPI000CCC7375|nr:VOC family protein [Xanthomonas citri]MCT8357930.1 VOC family protein [Xanthomonas citri pv. anacardii]MCT8361985.1 VOC family protein [Xanthomonas citri pv. anacardii]MCT8366006.1 VOC family protein [Xanthomonas citri pv. anacardii]MCT8370064.1 VOC family protein [Xanthomonas citri pv. anacardii]MCT8374027.1 VOC family protein [Xanthomonas citri pv. anacardii]
MDTSINVEAQTIPTLPSRSIPQTVAFYRQLGFVGDAHPHDAGYAILRRGDVDAVHAAMQLAALPERGIPRLDPVGDKPWGMREFAIVDESGNLLRIGQVIASG